MTGQADQSVSNRRLKVWIIPFDSGFNGCKGVLGRAGFVIRRCFSALEFSCQMFSFSPRQKNFPLPSVVLMDLKRVTDISDTI